MILGNVCTRSCGFCDVTFGRPPEVDWEEPARLGRAVARLGLRHAVITSVNRDELADGGAALFAASIRAVREQAKGCAIEVLIPDFQGKRAALASVFYERPDVLAHNLETVSRLHPTVRPQAKYRRSLRVLASAKEAGLATKTGLMLGLGESIGEVREGMADLVSVGCDILTLGQYLQPTARHLPVSRFVHPDEFAALKREGEAMGLRHVEAGPRVRSSYHAERQITPILPVIRADRT
jgi:lipoic acid synthetase